MFIENEINNITSLAGHIKTFMWNSKKGLGLYHSLIEEQPGVSLDIVIVE